MRSVEPNFVVLDKSGLLSLRLREMPCTFLVSTALWVEIWAGKPRKRDDCLRALDAIVDRSLLLLPFETLLQGEVFWRRPTVDLVDEEATGFVRQQGSFCRLGLRRIVEIEERYEPARLLWDYAQGLGVQVRDRLEQGDQGLASFLKDPDRRRRYQKLKDRALPRRVFGTVVSESGFPQPYDSLDDRWLVRHFCNAMAFVVWDEVLVRQRVHTLQPPHRFRSDYMDIQHMCLAALIGSIATRDTRMIRRLGVLRPGVTVVAA